MSDPHATGFRAVPARRRVGDSLWRYLMRNLLASGPALLAVLSIGLAFESLNLPPQCAVPSVANWMVCTDASAAAALALPTGRSFDQPPGGIDDAAGGAAIGEAAARLDWASRISLLIVAALLALAGSLYHARNSLMQQAHILGLADLPSWPRAGGPVALLRYVLRVRLPPTYPILGTVLVFAALAFLLLVAEMGVASRLSGRGFGDLWDAAWRLDWLLQPDLAMKWLLGRFDPAAGLLLRRAMLLVGLAMAAIGLLVVLVLLEAPGDRALRQSPAAATAAKMADYAESVREASYRRWLGRGFFRLKQAVWMGGALLAALVAEFGARYAWAMSFVDPARHEVLHALAKYAGSFTFVAGIGFSFTLFALYAPAVLSLRERGREYFRARCPNASNAEMESWLGDQGLSISLPASYTELLALLAPTGMAALGHVIGALAGQSLPAGS